MLSLSPGSVCDICLEPFDEHARAPCSVAKCGHVFCETCATQIRRPSCPLCRTPFEQRDIIRLHVDFDAIRAPPSTERSADPDDMARQLHERITYLALNGASESETTQLREDGRRFLGTLPKTSHPNLRTAIRLLKYICHLKSLYGAQRVTNETLTQELERLKEAGESVKAERLQLKGDLRAVQADRAALDSKCDNLQEQLENVQSQLALITEQNETAQNQLILLNEELQRLRMEFSSPEGDSPADIPENSQHLPDSSFSWTPVPESDRRPSDAPFFTPWDENTTKALPYTTESIDGRALCGRAGCPYSCDCAPFVLFSPQSRAIAVSTAGTIARYSPSAGPSGISLSLRQHTRSRSRSRSRPRSRSLSRAPSPSLGMNIPNDTPTFTQPHPLRGRLNDLLTDPVSSSLPNMSTHFPASSSPLSREVTSSLDRPFAPVARNPRDFPIPITATTVSPGVVFGTPSPLHPPMQYPSEGNPNRSTEDYSLSHPLCRERVGAAKPRQSSPYSHAHPPMLYGSPTSVGSLPAEISKSPIYRTPGATEDLRVQNEKEHRRVAKAPARRSIPPAYHPPMLPPPILPPSPSRLSVPTAPGLRPLVSPAGDLDGRSPAPPVLQGVSAHAYQQRPSATPPSFVHCVPANANVLPTTSTHAQRSLPSRQPSSVRSSGSNPNDNALSGLSFSVLDRHIKQTERDLISTYRSTLGASGSGHPLSGQV